MALNSLDTENFQELYHPSDRGSQYGSDAYIQLLRGHCINRSHWAREIGLNGPLRVGDNGPPMLVVIS